VVGALAGFTTLVRAEFAICAGALAIWLAIDQDARQRYRRVALFAAGFVIVLLPTTILNWRSIDEFNRTRVGTMPGPLPRFAPVTSYGPFNFANANHEGADGAFNWNLPGVTPSDDEAAGILEQEQLDLARPAVYRAYVDGYSIGVRWIRSNPTGAMRLVLEQARQYAVGLRLRVSAR
jgi:hypothetical protein